MVGAGGECVFGGIPQAYPHPQRVRTSQAATQLQNKMRMHLAGQDVV